MDEIILTQEDNNATISLDVGDILKIILTENSTTGYTWEVDGDLALQLQQASSEQKKTHKGSAGGSGKRLLIYKVVNAGNGILRLKYLQPWTGDSSIENRFNIAFELI